MCERMCVGGEGVVNLGEWGEKEIREGSVQEEVNRKSERKKRERGVWAAKSCYIGER